MRPAKIRSHARSQPRVDIDEVADLLTTYEEEPEEPWQKFTLDDLMRLLSSIDRPHRDVFVLTYIDQHSYQQVAAILGIQVNTVSSRLARARQQIRALLRERTRSF
jgi:RNA polymerase sigma-70 factor (ECF subfamily)